MNDNGCLILVEKVLGDGSMFNRQFIERYYATNAAAVTAISRFRRSARRWKTCSFRTPQENRDLFLKAGFARSKYSSSGTTSAGVRRGEVMVALGNFFFRFRTTLSPFLLLFLFVPGPCFVRRSVRRGGARVARRVRAGQCVRATTIGLALHRAGRQGPPGLCGRLGHGRAFPTQPQPAVRGQILHGPRRRCRVEQLVRARG